MSLESQKLFLDDTTDSGVAHVVEHVADKDVISSLPAYVLCHLCRLLMQACKQENPDPDVQASFAPGSKQQPYFALRSCSKALRDCCDELRTSILFDEHKQDQVEIYLRKLPHVRSISIFYNAASECYDWSDPRFPSLHSILPELESLSLFYNYAKWSAHILAADKDDVLLWSQTLQRFKAHCFAFYDDLSTDDQPSNMFYISELTNLRELQLINCRPKVQTEEIEGCTSLIKLTLKHIDLELMGCVNLDLSSCTLLQEVICTDYNIRSLGLDGLRKLCVLECNNSWLPELDVSSCTALTRLECSKSMLAKLDLSQNSHLQVLDCSFGNITELNLSGCLHLTELCCDSCKMTELDLSACTALSTLKCTDLKVHSLDLKSCSSLRILHADKCSNLQTLDLAGLKRHTYVTLQNSGLASLDLSQCVNLDLLDCQCSGSLTSLLVLGCCNINSLYLNHCGNLVVDLAGCTNLHYMHCN